jgi:hypothetical protein
LDVTDGRSLKCFRNVLTLSWLEIILDFELNKFILKKRLEKVHFENSQTHRVAALIKFYLSPELFFSVLSQGSAASVM